MKFETYLLLGILVFGVWRTNRGVQRAQTVAERNFTVRTSVFVWFLGLLVLGGILFLPLRAILLLLIPVFFGGVTLARLLREARDRLRQQAQERVDLERMKRVNEKQFRSSI
jgi:fatty acid desaturase